jgi:hypothetical protein
MGNAHPAQGGEPVVSYDAAVLLLHPGTLDDQRIAKLPVTLEVTPQISDHTLCASPAWLYVRDWYAAGCEPVSWSLHR